MGKNLAPLFLLIVSAALTKSSRAQAPGSVETIGGITGIDVFSIAAGDTTASSAETVYMGQGNYTINGTWEIYSKNVWISPDAVFTGTGAIRFYNPSLAGGIAHPTRIDGNNNAAPFDVNIELQNADNLILADLPGPGGAFTDLPGNATITIGKDFAFSAFNGDVLIGDHDLVTAATATLSNYRSTQFVVTNGTGHLVHNNYTGAFTYPIGIAEGDYTPAAINPGLNSSIHVMVQDYATSGSTESNNNGIERTWNIYADIAAANATVDLQHNTITNQATYNDALCFVTQYGPVTPNTSGQTTTSQTAWQSNNQAAGSGTGTLTTGAVIGTASERSLVYNTLAISAGDPAAFFSKSSDPVFTLPVNLLNFTGYTAGCAAILKWTTGEEWNVRYFELQNSMDGSVFTPVQQFAPKGSNSSYHYTVDHAGSPGLLYRLRIVDIDGRENFSKVLSLPPDCNEPFVLKAYPNPTSGTVIISGLVPQSRLRLINNRGQVLTEFLPANTSAEIDLGQLAGGMYLLQVVRETRVVKTIKLIKK
ncbi:MAG: T9SS type A sorting domain-containing protein [Sphingobacteriales bacterium]|nr:T9SS type A sorting domain-containing protein [Sphingobacteriales bacterium]